MTVEPEALAEYLESVFGLLVGARFGAAVDLSSAAAPVGVSAMFASDAATDRVHTGTVALDPPIATRALQSIVEASVGLDDGSTRLLLRSADRPPSSNGPVRVTVAAPTASLERNEDLASLIVMFPDRYTSPTGITLGMVLADEHVPPSIDLVSVLDPGGPLRRLADLVDGHDDLTGVRWVDDAARLFGTEPMPSTFFGAPPHFIPIMSVGVDFMTLGLLWDRPESGRLEDKWLYLISPGGSFQLESKISLKGWIAGHVRTELESAAGERAERLDEVLAVVGRRTKSADVGVGGGLKRSKPKDLGPDERWVSHVYGGDGVRAPAATFAPKPIRFCADGWVGVEAANRAMAAGLPGSALHAAGSGLRQATGGNDGHAVHALYHAMVDAYDAVGREVLADRCRALTTAAAPIVSAPPPAPAPPPRIWAVPAAHGRADLDITGVIDQTEPIAVSHGDVRLSVEPRLLRPVDLAALPGATLFDLLDSGVLAVDSEDRCFSEHGKPLVGTRVGEWYVVASLWEQPAVPGVRVEAVLPWDDDAADCDEVVRYELVRYVPLDLALDPFDEGTVDETLRFVDRAAIKIPGAPFDTPVESMRSAQPHAAPRSANLDALRSQYHLNGLVLSPRAAAIITGGSAAAEGADAPVLPVVIDGSSVDFRYVARPFEMPVDWAKSSFVVTKGSRPQKIVRRLDADTAPADLAALRELNARLAVADGDREFCRPNVAVLTSTPPLLRILGEGYVVRSDVAERMSEAGLRGISTGDRSRFYVTAWAQGE